ncbi:MAG: hypothetical protein ACRBBN_03370 [Methyloligellaceae bacterium]
MRPISVAFSKVKVLVIGQDEVIKDRMKAVLTGFGVPKAGISDCTVLNNQQGNAFHDYDLIVFDCASDRFSRELALDELAGEEGGELPPIPVILIAEGDAEISAEQAFGDKEYIVIGPYFCAKSLYLKLHMMMSKFNLPSVSENSITVEERLKGCDYQVPAI